jgi:hypothetical protein
MFQKRTLIIVFVVVALGLAFGTFFIRSNPKQDTKKVKASTATNTITTQADWDAGTKVNLLSTSGQITLDNVATTPIDLVARASADPSVISASADSSDVLKPVDGVVDPLTAWPASAWEVHLTSGLEQHEWWQVDLGTTYQLSGVSAFADALSGDFKIQTSTNGTDFTDHTGYDFSSAGYIAPGWHNATFSVQAKYVRLEVKLIGGVDPDPYLRLSEFHVSTAGYGTHTTGATQIDGGENFWEWESFTPTQSVPANTSVTYRFRTSTNGSDWTGWVGSIGEVTSRTGDDSNNPTKYRYLQIEATLSNTDGASTPTIDQYDIGYHIEHKPNKPTAQTAVVN